jgi:hypothetical protein
MTVGQGAGQPAGKGIAVCERAIVYTLIEPLVTADPGRPDSSGTLMHWRYTGNTVPDPRLGNSYTRSNNSDPTLPDFVPSQIVTEFDAQTRITLPFSGTLEAIGGLGDYRVMAFVAGWFSDWDEYKPSLKTLMTMLGRGGTFTVPDYHTILLGSSTGDQFRLPASAGGTLIEPSIVLPGAPVFPGWVLTAINATVAKTGFEG